MKISPQILATETCGREVILSKKPWNVFKSVLCFMVFLVVTNSCKYNQVHKCNSLSNCSCVNCLICPPGKGLYPPCMRTEVLTKNKTMKCLPCKRGTYSENSDFGSCHSCQQCQGTKIVVECNATHDAVCGKECEHGYQWDDLLQMCMEVKMPITDPTDRPRVKTPMSKSSLAPTSRTNGPRTKVPITDPTERPGVTVKVNPSLTPSSKTISHDSRATIGHLGTKYEDQGVATSTKMKETIIISAVVVVAVFCFVVLHKVNIMRKIRNFICRAYCSSDQQRVNSEVMTPMRPEQQGQALEQIVPVSSEPEREEHFQSTVANNGDEDPDQIMIISSLSGDERNQSNQPNEDVEKIAQADPSKLGNSDLDSQLLLSETPSDNACKIAVKITKNGWKKIGMFYGVPKHKLEEMETRSKYSQGEKLPGEFLLEFLPSFMPQLTLNEFKASIMKIQKE